MNILDDLPPPPIKRRWSLDFVGLPRDYLRAMALAALAPEQSLALLVAIDASTQRDWRRREPAPFRPDLPSLARELGVSVEELARGFDGLEARGMVGRPLGADGQRDYVIWTDFRDWHHADGSPMFDDAQVAAILATLKTEQPAPKRFDPPRE